MKIFYFKNTINFGDELNNEIFKLFIDNIEYTNSIYAANAIGIGSILDSLFYNDQSSFLEYLKRKKYYFESLPINILGSGFINDEKKLTFLKRKINIIGLRGKQTQNRLEKLSKKKNIDAILGDPGLLSSELINKNNIIKKYKLGIIPHYVDKKNPLINYLKNTISGSCIINIQDTPTNVMSKIMQCDFIISSAMHGLIASDSLGIPNMRLILSDKIYGGDYKYEDYYSIYDKKNHYKLDFTNQNIFEEKLDEQYLLKKITENYSIDKEDVFKHQNNIYKHYEKTIKNLL